MKIGELEEIRAWMVAGKVLELTCEGTTIILHPAAFAPDTPPGPEDKPRLTQEQIMNRRKFAHVGGG